MVVQHNLTAMNSNRQLGITSSLQAKSSEKLSSGYKINRAADDAAGLSISEKMRSLSIRLLYLLEQFFSIYRNALRSLDSDFYLFSLYFKDGKLNVISDNDTFTGFP